LIGLDWIELNWLESVGMAHLRRFGRHELYGHILPDNLSNHAPGLHKWWKAWTRQNGQITEHLSPYRQKIVTPLFRDPFHKLQHKILDNWHVLPGLAITGVWWWTPYKEHELEKETWP